LHGHQRHRRARSKATFPAAYQATSRLAYYATLFNSMEINSTFYRIPQPKTFAAWAAETGPAFDFTLKLWRDMTHTKTLAEDLSGIARFMDAARELGSKKGCLLIQFPPSNTIRQLNAVSALFQELAAADPAHEWRIALELRPPAGILMMRLICWTTTAPAWCYTIKAPSETPGLTGGRLCLYALPRPPVNLPRTIP
jgi:uncharacterized protein YecE (DUF72 family)